MPSTIALLALLMTSASADSPTCVPKGSTSSRQPSDCPGTILLIVPLVVNNLVAIARGGGKGDDLGNWTPMRGLLTIVGAVIVAVLSAVLTQTGGFGANLSVLVLLWLTRPRLLWSLMGCFVVFGEGFKQPATDALLADVVMAVLGFPFAILGIASSLGSKRCSDNNTTAIFGVAAILEVAFGGVYIFALVALLWKRALGRRWAIAACSYSFILFGIAWFFWIGTSAAMILSLVMVLIKLLAEFIIVAGDGYCPANIGPITALHAVLPIFNALVRAWVPI
ncbi:hypothetical protein H2199_007619 [Coniosporium tulheliwenetii]|uniref:Uncharacterized protein n=1 Tax=Coniosporium tulheliwenetii TaxID=3383036 RepID=A0ACC2YPL5_9PEZI|nr:hypothetical protein H2199_007619 [Cladosporium sp. JES 115]